MRDAGCARRRTNAGKNLDVNFGISGFYSVDDKPQSMILFRAIVQRRMVAEKEAPIKAAASRQ
jgi:hypothetical protein